MRYLWVGQCILVVFPTHDSLASLKTAKWYSKLTRCQCIFTMDHVLHFWNQLRKFYSVSVLSHCQQLKNVIRKCIMYNNLLYNNYDQLHNTVGNIKCPQKLVKEAFLMWHLHFFISNSPESNYLIFVSFAIWLVIWFSFEMATSIMFWSKIHIFFNLGFKRSAWLSRSFWYQNYGRRWMLRRLEKGKTH